MNLRYLIALVLCSLTFIACSGSKKPVAAMVESAQYSNVPFTVAIELLPEDNGIPDQLLCQVFVANEHAGKVVKEPEEQYPLMHVYEGGSEQIIIPPDSLIFSTQALIGVRCAHNSTGENTLYFPRNTPRGPVTNATGLVYQFDNSGDYQNKYNLVVVRD